MNAREVQNDILRCKGLFDIDLRCPEYNLTGRDITVCIKSTHTDPVRRAPGIGDMKAGNVECRIVACLDNDVVAIDGTTESRKIRSRETRRGIIGIRRATGKNGDRCVARALALAARHDFNGHIRY
ncbi:hypothetical protein [Aurantimonas sp. VKM B-3413]|uniref:hypothetical protein n=1 Tax=Aurantimonas sp. VKM B-3413 TaxID=2779401 RepID=UPI001E3A946C|nr:hypothetical protein [Aurantimonas sp. VKM B-3413]